MSKNRKRKMIIKMDLEIAFSTYTYNIKISLRWRIKRR